MKSSDQNMSITQYHELGQDQVGLFLLERTSKDRTAMRHSLLAGAFVALCVGMIGLQFLS